MENNEPSTSMQDNNLGKRKRLHVKYFPDDTDDEKPSVGYTPREKYDCCRSKEAKEPSLVTKDKSDTDSVLIESNSNTPSPPNLPVPSFDSDYPKDEHRYAMFVFKIWIFFKLLVNFYVLKNLSIPLICSCRFDATSFASTSHVTSKTPLRTILVHFGPSNTKPVRIYVPQVLKRKAAVDANNMERSYQTNQNLPGPRFVLFGITLQRLTISLIFKNYFNL